MPPRKLISLWTQHLKDDKAKEDFEKILRNSTITLGRLREILEKRLDSLERTEVNSKAYDNPNWPYKMADFIGMKRALRNILDLVAFTKRGN